MKQILLILTLTLTIFACKKKSVEIIPLTVSENGLVAYYPLDGNANDLTSFRNHGTISALSTSDRKGTPNKAYDFVRHEFQSSKIPINLKNNYTFSFWIKMNFYDDGMAVMELAKDKNCNRNPQIWQLQNSIYLTPTTDPFNSIKIMSLGGIKTGTESPSWKHVLWTVQNDSTSVYVNGNLVGTKMLTWPDLTNVDLTLGTAGNHCTGDSGASNYHNQPSRVSIDEVRIYNRVLSFTEIRELSRF